MGGDFYVVSIPGKPVILHQSPADGRSNIKITPIFRGHRLIIPGEATLGLSSRLLAGRPSRGSDQSQAGGQSQTHRK
jgi:hypothetical protein